MIDHTKPMELVTGEPARFVRKTAGGNIVVDIPSYPFGGARNFLDNGKHVWGELPDLRNVTACACGPNSACFRCPPTTLQPKAAPSNPYMTPSDANTVPASGVLNELSLPDDDAKRQEYPMADGLLDYFPNALAEVSRVSKIGNDQHNPGEPMNWARDKSTDHANKIMRHLVDRGRFDGRGVRHTARLAWRALAMLQTELEQEEGFPQSRRSTGQAPLQALA